MIRRVIGIALFHLGAAISDISVAIDPEPEEVLNEDVPGWVDSLTIIEELPEED